MLLRDLATVLDARVLTESCQLDIDVTTACGADLMSDVLVFVHSGVLLLTGLINPQVVITGEVAEVAAIVIVRGKQPPPETIQLAETRGIPLISAPHTMFECCGRLYAAGLESCDVRGEDRLRIDHMLRERTYLSSANV